MAYQYIKADQKHPSPGKLIPRYLRLAPILISSLGLAMVAAVAWPMVSYSVSQFFHNENQDSGLLSPIYYEALGNEDINPTPGLIGDVDYTRASNWFSFSPQDQPPITSTTQNTAQSYTLSIPSLGIKGATVKANSEDLSSSLIQYHQTSFPGESGTPVIFGHSSLPQLFDPKNYLTIFATLPTIKTGSDIIIDYQGVTFTYRVKKTFEVKPTEISVLRQDYSQKTLKLITCVPPGTKIRRLVVEADLIKL
jgi:sortase A